MVGAMNDDAALPSAPPFGLDRFLELPRVSGLALSTDGRRPFTGLMALVDVTVARADVAETRTAAADARLRYFPDEDHWILRPPHVRVWYETVLAFLDQHVLGKDWVRPGLL